MAETTLLPLEPPSQIDVRARAGAVARVATYLSVPALPDVNRFVATRAGDCYGLGPDEWLVVGPRSARAAIQDALESAVGADEGAAIDVSSSRVLVELRGPSARDVLASCCALDLHPRVFERGHCAQTLVAKAPVLLAQRDETPAYWVFVRPSLASYVVSWLADGIEGLSPGA
ncbi:MAG TPA: sarcosine oxidase subunit gamma family protein [Vicinamibacteria bacterium]|nr:sarcosine oxidase subunit gamma family protein [Vicinamibacteria bacterium]